MRGTINVLGGTANAPSVANRKDRSAMGSIPAPSFYVYILCRPNGKPFYVGKGHGRRVYSHELEARRNCHCHKCNTIRKIWKSGGEVQRYIVFTTDIEQEAFDHEIELIALYGLKSLVNQTIGGQGPSGRTPSAKERAAMSAAAKAMWADPQQRARASAQTKASWNDPELRAKRVANVKANAGSTKARQRSSERQTKLYQDPEQRRLQSERSKAAYSSPEARRQKGERSSAVWADPEARAKQSERMKAWWAARKASERE